VNININDFSILFLVQVLLGLTGALSSNSIDGRELRVGDLYLMGLTASAGSKFLRNGSLKGDREEREGSGPLARGMNNVLKLHWERIRADTRPIRWQ
jgi:hypothetical protein